MKHPFQGRLGTPGQRPWGGWRAVRPQDDPGVDRQAAVRIDEAGVQVEFLDLGIAGRQPGNAEQQLFERSQINPC